MADTTREAEVKANYDDVVLHRGEEAWPQIIVTLLYDISVTLAKLFDK
jgi:hypothetical protein